MRSTPAFADITASLRSPLSRVALLRGRYVAGTLAAAGSVAVFLAGGGTADAQPAHAAPTTRGSTTSPVVKQAKPTPKATTSRYTIQRGDTLTAIAARAGVTIDAIVAANKIANQHRIIAGDQLVIPPKAAVSVAPATPAPATTSNSKAGVLPTDFPTGSSRFKLRATFDAAAAKHGVPADLLKAMAWNESGWQNDVVSHTGAIGVGQLMPDTIEFVNTSLISKPLNPRVPEQNVHMSAAFLRYLLDQTHGDYRMALAAYYQGLRSVRERGMYDDTKQYVNTVVALKKGYF